jgi:hypothetical protein
MELVHDLLGTPVDCQGGNIEKKQQERFSGSLRSVSLDPEQVVKMLFSVKCIVVFLPGEVGACL